MSEKDNKSEIEPSTIYDGMKEVKEVPAEDRAKWMSLTNLIYRQSHREGYNKGFDAGLAVYSRSAKAIFNSGAFVLGFTFGTFAGSFLLIAIWHGITKH
jgi:hypothetical protein